MSLDAAVEPLYGRWSPTMVTPLCRRRVRQMIVLTSWFDSSWLCCWCPVQFSCSLCVEVTAAVGSFLVYAWNIQWACPQTHTLNVCVTCYFLFFCPLGHSRDCPVSFHIVSHYTPTPTVHVLFSFWDTGNGLASEYNEQSQVADSFERRSSLISSRHLSLCDDDRYRQCIVSNV